MPLPYGFHPRAQLDLESAALSYEEARSGLGETFTAAVMATVENVADWPGMGAPVDDGGGRRRFRVRGFPYYVGYWVTDKGLQVLAVAHERRRPDFWTSRR